MRLVVMPNVSTRAALLITGALALLLIAYVFTGRAPAGVGEGTHCASQEALSQIRAELFRRAGAVRQGDAAAFDNVARYSVVRAPSRMLRRHQGNSGKVTCTGAIAVDLPPGLVTSDQHRSLESSVTYDLQPGAGGRTRLLSLRKADAIVVPLATLLQEGKKTDQPLAAATPVNQTERPAIAVLQPPASRPKPPRPSSRARTEPAKSPPPPAAAPEPAPAPTPAVPASKLGLSPPSTAAASLPTLTPRSAIVTRTPPPVTVAADSPSFSCRRARKRGEREVCADPDLATLDRQMAAQLARAMALARPGQRAMLRNSGRRFLRYRNSCDSAACITNAYRGRMREVSDIMQGGW